MVIDTLKFINELKETFDYKNGKLYRNGKLAGYFDKSSGYYKCKFKKKGYLIHRIIFAIHHGYMPKMIDHIDRDKSNNKIENLRECKERCLNTVNSKVRIDSSSGFKGVAWHKCGKWQASVFKNGKRHYIGLFDNPVDAAKEYNKLAKNLFGEFAYLNNV